MVMAYRLACGMLLAILFGVSLPVLAQQVPGLQPERKDRIAMQFEGAGASDTDLQLMFSDGTSPAELPSHTATQRPRMTPALAPDGRTLAFVAMQDGRPRLFQWTLTSQNTAVGAPRLVTSATNMSEKFPVWSPDARQLAYIAADGKTTTLRIINRDGTGMRTLATVHHVALPAWAPNGQSIIFIDKVGGKTHLKQVTLAGGVPTVLRQDLPVSAVSVSPDSLKLACLVTTPKGTSDLWVIPSTGKGGTKIVTNIVGAKNVIWYAVDQILFGAQKVGTASGGDVWVTNATGKPLRGLQGYLDSKRVSYISVHKGDLSAAGLPGFDPNVPAGPDSRTTAPEQRLPSGPVMIARPLPGDVVRGKTPLKVIAQKGVATINIKIGEQFTYSTGVQKPSDRAPEVAITWNTQELLLPDPTLGIPRAYRDLQMYPDGDYKIIVHALDRDNNTIGTDNITVRVQNTLPDDGGFKAQVLRYGFDMKQRTTEYNISGRGLLFGPNAYVAKPLDAQFQAKMRRYLIEVNDGEADVRTRVIANTLPLRYGTTQISIPETNISGRYTVTPQGAYTVVPQMMRKVYLPLSQLAVPLSSNPVRPGSSWTGDMWVVPELLERRAMRVSSTNTVEGIEIIDGRKAVRIRSDLRIDTSGQGFALSLAPSRRSPGLNAGVPNEPDKSIPVQSANGVRFSWFDYNTKSLLRVEDVFLYSFQVSQVPNLDAAARQAVQAPSQQPIAPRAGFGPPPGAGAPVPPGLPPAASAQPQAPAPTYSSLSGTASYAVRYTYLLDGVTIE